MIVESDGSDFRLGEFKADRGALLRLALRRGWDGGWACNDEIVHQLFKQCRFTKSRCLGPASEGAVFGFLQFSSDEYSFHGKINNNSNSQVTKHPSIGKTPGSKKWKENFKI